MTALFAKYAEPDFEKMVPNPVERAIELLKFKEQVGGVEGWCQGTFDHFDGEEHMAFEVEAVDLELIGKPRKIAEIQALEFILYKRRQKAEGKAEDGSEKKL